MAPDGQGRLRRAAGAEAWGAGPAGALPEAGVEDGGAHLLYAGAVPGGAGAPRDRGLVPGVVTTQETGLEKRDPALYRQAAARWGVPPEDCVLFEDSPGYCAAAGEAGFYVAGVRDPCMPDGRRNCAACAAAGWTVWSSFRRSWRRACFPGGKKGRGGKLK